LEKKAYIYVCGDAANMAREVNATIGRILAQNRGIPETKADEIVKNMRAANQYQVRIPPYWCHTNTSGSLSTGITGTTTFRS
jgi:hypothetical protein